MKFRRTISLFLLLGTVGGIGCVYPGRGRSYRAYDNDGRERRWERRENRRDWRDYRQQRRWWWLRDRDRDWDDD